MFFFPPAWGLWIADTCAHTHTRARSISHENIPYCESLNPLRIYHQEIRVLKSLLRQRLTRHFALWLKRVSSFPRTPSPPARTAFFFLILTPLDKLASKPLDFPQSYSAALNVAEGRTNWARCFFCRSSRETL